MIYLLHFSKPYKHARHYLGYAEESAERRLERHKAGRGARLTKVVTDAGIDLVMVRTWPDGTRDQERAMKKRKNTPALCPICNPKASFAIDSLSTIN